MQGPRGIHMMTALTTLMETMRRLERRFSVVKFSGPGTQKLLKDISEDMTEKRGEAIIEEMNFSGGTHLLDGLDLALSDGFGNNPDKDVYRAVILLTDGLLTSGTPDQYYNLITGAKVPVSFCMVHIYEDDSNPVEVKQFLTQVLTTVGKRHGTAYSPENNLASLPLSQSKSMATILATLLEKQINIWETHYKTSKCVPLETTKFPPIGLDALDPHFKVLPVPRIETPAIRSKDLFIHSARYSNVESVQSIPKTVQD